MTRATRAVVVVAIGIAMGASISAERAHACGNAITYSTVELVRAIHDARSALERGQYVDAVRALHAVRARHSSNTSDEVEELVDRARLVWIRAIVRGGISLDAKDDDDGAFSISGSRGLTGPRNLEEAMSTLDYMLVKRPAVADEVREVRAEVMARVVATRRAGVRELEKLAAKDLLTAPESWALLADALEARGDIEPALHAHDRCARMAANRVVQCARTPAHVARR